MSDATALKDQANKAFAAKQYDSAIDLYSQAIALDPTNHVLYSNRSAAYAGKRQWDLALQDAEETVKVNPTWSKGFARKGAALHGAKRWDEAIKAYEDGLKLEGDKPTPALLKGLKEVQDAQRTAVSSGRDQSNPMGTLFSDPQLFQKLAANPRTAPLLADQAFMAQLKLMQANPQLASSALQDPRMIQVLGVLMGVDMEGFSREREERKSNAPASPSTPFPPTPTSPRQSQFTPSASTSTPSASTSKSAPPPSKPEPEAEPEEIDEDKASALKEKALGSEAYKKRDLDAAEIHFSKAWELYPSDITFLTNLAAVYFEKGDYPKTIETCEKAIDEGRSIRADYKLIAKAYGRIGSAYYKQADFDNAIKFYNKSLTEHRTSDILHKLKETEKEKKERDIKAYINPELSAAAREEGNALFKKGDFAASVKSYTEAIARNPSDARGYNNRAAAYQKLVAFPEALKDADKAIEVDPVFVKAYLRKSLILTAMREYPKAMEAAQRASDADTEHKHTREIEEQLQKVSMTMYESRSNESEEETLQRAMRDPEVASIMQDPVIQQILQQAQNEPRALMDHMKNPVVREKINKLVAAGIIKTR